MQRKKGIALLASGILLATVSLAGVFAATTDSAQTGNLSIETAGIVDLQMGGNFTTDGGATPHNCANAAGEGFTYTDQDGSVAISDFITITGAEPGEEQVNYTCIRNFGGQNATITAEVINSSTVEVGACSPSESAAGDTTCNNGDPGELADDVEVQVHATAGDLCTGADSTPVTHDGTNGTFSGSMADFGNPDNVLDAGDEACLQIKLRYLTTAEAGFSQSESLRNQNDKTTFRIRFNATSTTA